MQGEGVTQSTDTGPLPGPVGHTQPLPHSFAVIVCAILLENKYFDVEGVRVHLICYNHLL